MTNYATVRYFGGAFFMDSQAGSEAAPTILNSTVERTREYLTRSEVEALMTAARKNSRYGHRNATMILIAYRHGLRASEVCDLRWHQVELATGRLHVRRSKRGTPAVNPLQGDELRALRRLQREQAPGAHVFVSERGAPMAPKSFHALVQQLGERAGMPFAIHPHMLRHGCGYELANKGHDTRALQALARAPQRSAHGALH
jgi:integrase